MVNEWVWVGRVIQRDEIGVKMGALMDTCLKKTDTEWGLEDASIWYWEWKYSTCNATSRM